MRLFEENVKRPDVPSDKGDFSSRGQPSRVSVTSTSLLERLQGPDEESWNRLVRLYGPLVYSWCRRKGLQSQDAADVAQEAFQAVARSLNRFRRDRPGDSFRKWLKTITNNKIYDHLRRQQWQPRAAGGTDAQMRLAQATEETVEVHLDDEEAAETNHLLRQALELVRAEFEPATWAAFWGTAVEGRKSTDVAADLGLSPNAVRIAKSRVRSRLRQEFGELLD